VQERSDHDLSPSSTIYDSVFCSPDNVFMCIGGRDCVNLEQEGNEQAEFLASTVRGQLQCPKLKNRS
jgi:hypothetical protein